jgi:hypothetical protein
MRLPNTSQKLYNMNHLARLYGPAASSLNLPFHTVATIKILEHMNGRQISRSAILLRIFYM